jgi:nucleotide-binding universal stress UspA family protein
VAKTPAAPAPDAAPDSPVGPGKNRPTPSRAQQEAARKRPLVPDTKEARRRAKLDLAAQRERARIGMANGEEKFLPVRDRGPQRRWVRDFVDAGWHPGELLMPLMLVVIVLSLVPNAAVVYYGFIALWIYILFVVADMIVTGARVRKRVTERFGDRTEKGLRWYAGMRTVQMRFMRLPKPQVARGQYPA